MSDAARAGPTAGGGGLYGAWKAVNDLIERVVVAFACLVVAVIVLLPFLGTAVRWATGEGYSFLAETAPQLVPWMVFPMIGVLLRSDGHIAVDMLPHYLRGGPLTALRVAVLAISAAGCIAMGWYGARTTAFFAKLGQMSTTELEFPLWYLYVSYPVGLFLAANFCLESMVGEALGRRARRASEVL